MHNSSFNNKIVISILMLAIIIEKKVILTKISFVVLIT